MGIISPRSLLRRKGLDKGGQGGQGGDRCLPVVALLTLALGTLCLFLFLEGALVSTGALPPALFPPTVSLSLYSGEGAWGAHGTLNASLPALPNAADILRALEELANPSDGASTPLTSEAFGTPGSAFPSAGTAAPQKVAASSPALDGAPTAPSASSRRSRRAGPADRALPGDAPAAAAASGRDERAGNSGVSQMLDDPTAGQSSSAIAEERSSVAVELRKGEGPPPPGGPPAPLDLSAAVATPGAEGRADAGEAKWEGAQGEPSAEAKRGRGGGAVVAGMQTQQAVVGAERGALEAAAGNGGEIPPTDNARATGGEGVRDSEEVPAEQGGNSEAPTEQGQGQGSGSAEASNSKGAELTEAEGREKSRAEDMRKVTVENRGRGSGQQAGGEEGGRSQSQQAQAGEAAGGVPTLGHGGDWREVEKIKKIMEGLGEGGGQGGDNTVVVTPANSGFLDMALNLRCRLLDLGARNLLLWALDKPVADELAARGIPYYYDAGLFAISEAKGYHDQDYIRMMSERPRVWWRMLATGRSMLFLDADVVAFDHPKGYFDRTADIEGQVNGWGWEFEKKRTNASHLCAGVFWMRSSDLGLRFMEKAFETFEEMRPSGKRWDDQMALNWVLHNPKVSAIITSGVPEGQRIRTDVEPGIFRASFSEAEKLLPGHLYWGTKKEGEGYSITFSTRIGGEDSSEIKFHPALFHMSGHGKKSEKVQRMKENGWWEVDDDLKCRSGVA